LIAKTLDSEMKKSTSCANLRLLVLLQVASCSISSVSPGLFTHYRLHSGKRIADRHLAALQLSEVYTLSARFRDPQIDCGVACNLNPACTAFSLNSRNICALFNDQISLIHLENQTNSTVYANHKMSTCIKDFYPDLVAMNCFPKKVEDADCNASIECSDSKGLECADVNLDNKVDTCKCRNPDSNYWDATAATCVPKLTYGQPCQSVSQCLPSKGLDCTGSCACSLPDQFFWNTTADQCTPRQSSGGPCQSVGQCLHSNGLDCLDTNGDALIDSCTCPDPTNQYWDASLNRCNCLNLAAFYWDDVSAKRCFAKKLYGASCSATQECQTNYYLNCIGGFCQTISPGYKTTDNIYTGKNGFGSCRLYSFY
jgi:hypothetical protein